MNDIRRVLSYNDVLLVPRNSDLDHLTDADISYFYGHAGAVIKVNAPIINAPMDKVCSIKLLTCLCKDFNLPVTIDRWFENVDEQIQFYNDCDFNKEQQEKCFISIGITTKWQEWIEKLIQFRIDEKQSFGLVVDVANGDTKASVETVKFIKNILSSIGIIAGNVATRSGFARLQDAGADFIRVGIGGGSICTTRTNTGFGLPTLTSVFDCAKIKDTAQLIADGGIETPGDICKAMAAGADLVMLGKMLAGTNLAPGEKLDRECNITIDEEEYTWISYSGMASKEAIKKLKSKKSIISIEGVSGYIPYTGTTKEVVTNIIGNLQSAVSYYAGCTNWDEFRKKVKFVEITQQGWEESKTRIINFS